MRISSIVTFGFITLERFKIEIVEAIGSNSGKHKCNVTSAFSILPNIVAVQCVHASWTDCDAASAIKTHKMYLLDI